MNNKIAVAFVVSITFFCAGNLYAQAETVKQQPHYKIGIFAPLYLDSVFTKNTFRYRQGIPKFIAPAVDFINGAQLALDSLGFGDNYIDASIYDTKSYTETVADLIQKKKLDSLQLIIGSVKDAEYLQLADFALQKNIPFISVTYPNNAGITGNPFLVIMNSTLKAHCDAIYSYILQNHSTDKIYLLRQKGVQEDMVASYFKAMNVQENGQPLLQIETINTDDNLNASFLKSKLDSNSKNIIIGGSLDEKFANNLVKAAFDISKTFPITLIGMPNWDSFSMLYDKKKLADFPIYYSTPYYNEKKDAYSRALMADYNTKFKGKASDMVFKGFESVYMFTKLLIKDSTGFMNHINDASIKVFCEYNFKPVRLKDKTAIPDYFENKHLYLVKIFNGVTSKAW